MENSNHLTESWSLSWQSVLSSQLWRLEHLYWIENKAGQLQRFSLNRAQRRLHERLWYRNDILKARQLGIFYVCGHVDAGYEPVPVQFSLRNH